MSDLDLIEGFKTTLKNLVESGPGHAFAVRRRFVADSGVSLQDFIAMVHEFAPKTSFIFIDRDTDNIVITNGTMREYVEAHAEAANAG